MNHIIVDPDICNGQPVIKGTRITVRTVLEFLAAGDSIDEVLEEYPSLTTYGSPTLRAVFEISVAERLKLLGVSIGEPRIPPAEAGELFK